MMQSRRWWKSIVSAWLLGVCLAGAARIATAAPAPPGPPPAPADVATAIAPLKGAAVVAYRTSVNASAATLNVTEKNRYAEKLGTALEPVIKGANVDAAINAIVLLVDLDVLFADRALVNALPNPNPAIRYWAAKGLGNIMDRTRNVGPAAVAKLNGQLRDQLKVETSGIVKQQILRALAASGDVASLSDALLFLAQTLEKSPPDIGAINASTVGLDGLLAAIKAGATLNPTEKADALNALAQTLSFTSQHNLALAEKDILPDAQASAAVDLARSGVALLNALADKEIAKLPNNINNSSSAGELFLGVSGIVGSPKVPGDLQKTFPAIPAPGEIKSPTTTTTAPKSTTTKP